MSDSAGQSSTKGYTTVKTAPLTTVRGPAAFIPKKKDVPLPRSWFPKVFGVGFVAGICLELFMIKTGFYGTYVAYPTQTNRLLMFVDFFLIFFHFVFISCTKFPCISINNCISFTGSRKSRASASRSIVWSTRSTSASSITTTRKRCVQQTIRIFFLEVENTFVYFLFIEFPAFFSFHSHPFPFPGPPHHRGRQEESRPITHPHHPAPLSLTFSPEKWKEWEICSKC